MTGTHLLLGGLGLLLLTSKKNGAATPDQPAPGQGAPALKAPGIGGGAPPVIVQTVAQTAAGVSQVATSIGDLVDRIRNYDNLPAPRDIDADAAVVGPSDALSAAGGYDDTPYAQLGGGPPGTGEP